MNLSIIIPAFNCPDELRQCLAAIARTADDAEVIVVDDASTDNATALVAAQAGVPVLRMSQNGGPGAARNAGVKAASGAVLVFVDSDVVVQDDTIARIARVMHDDPSVAALFGSYDDAPAAPQWVSVYRNLLHHYVHQTGAPEASTFWAGLGAVRREAFETIGGFDARRFPRPSIEDIDLGYRLRAAGFRIRLDRTIQAKHLKRWTLRSILKTDIFCRALPWSRLLLQSNVPAYELNLNRSQRASAALSLLCVLLLPLAAVRPWTIALALACLGGVVVLNRDLYRFFAAKRGLVFAIGSFALHTLYLVYSAAAFAFVRIEHAIGHRSGPAVRASGACACSEYVTQQRVQKG